MALLVTGNKAAQEEIHDHGHSAIQMDRPIPFWVPPEFADPKSLPDKALGGSTEGPDYSANPWEQLRLNDKLVPGKSFVKCVPRIKLKANKTVGRDGGPTIEEGHEAAAVTITITIWTPSQWNILQDLMRELWRRPGEPMPSDPTKKAIAIEARACEQWGVTSILIESPESLEPGPEHGTQVMKIKAVQYIAPKQAVVTKPIAGAGRVHLDPAFDRPKNTPTAISMPSVAESSARPPTPGAAGSR